MRHRHTASYAPVPKPFCAGTHTLFMHSCSQHTDFVHLTMMNGSVSNHCCFGFRSVLFIVSSLFLLALSSSCPCPCFFSPCSRCFALCFSAASSLTLLAFSSVTHLRIALLYNSRLGVGRNRSCISRLFLLFLLFIVRCRILSSPFLPIAYHQHFPPTFLVSYSHLSAPQQKASMTAASQHHQLSTQQVQVRVWGSGFVLFSSRAHLYVV